MDVVPILDIIRDHQPSYTSTTFLSRLKCDALANVNGKSVLLFTRSDNLSTTLSCYNNSYKDNGMVYITVLW